MTSAIRSAVVGALELSSGPTSGSWWYIQYKYIIKLFKLAQLVYRSEILGCVVMGKNKHLRPSMEIGILWVMTLLIDFVLVIWIG